MPQRWALQLGIDGDLRFVSHLDCIRGIERTAARAKVPLQFSQGFNPHPVFSLACPRPVGVTTKDDLVVLNLDSPMQGDELCRVMTDHAPQGMTFGKPRVIEDRRTPRPVRIVYELRLDDADRVKVARSIDRISAMSSWPAERVKKSRKPGKPGRSRTVDLRELIESIVIDGDVLRWVGRPLGDLWAKPGEILSLVAMDPQAHLARVVRTTVTYDQ